MHVSTESVQSGQDRTIRRRPTRACRLSLSVRPAKDWCIRAFVALWLLILVVVNATMAQTKYTADFSTQPTINKDGYATDWPWNSTVTVNLGGVDYLITDAINGSYTWNGSAIVYSTAGDANPRIKRKDGQPFNFYGVKLQYTNYRDPVYYTYPFLTIQYSTTKSALADEKYDGDQSVTVTKPNGVGVTQVVLAFHGLNTLTLDDLVVGPTGTIVNAPPTVTTSAPASIQTSSSILGGNVTADGGAAITERGVVYSPTRTTPTTSDNKTANGSGLGTFSQTITGLSSSTTYYARAYAINAAGTSYGSVQMFTTLVPAPVFTRQPVVTTACVGNTAIFTVTATGAASFQWQQSASADFANSMAVAQGSTITTSGTSSTLTVAASASLDGHYFRAIASNASGNTNSSTAPLTVFILNAPGVQNVTYCQSAMASALTATAAAGNSLKWYTSAGAALPDAPTPSTASTTSTTYYVSQINTNGCESGRAGLTVTINPMPTVSISPSTTAICAGQSTILTASGADTYRWSTAQTTANISVSTTGTFSVTATTTSTGCSALATSSVTIKAALATPGLQASALITNQPISVTASGCPTGMLNWTPQGGMGSASGSVYTFTQPGSYTISATCTVDGCTSPSSISVMLQILPAGFAIASVNTINCQLSKPGEYQVRFTPVYSGANENPINFAVVNELAATTAPAPYLLRLYTDNPVITLVSNQAGNTQARFTYNWLASCQTGTSPNQAPTTLGIPNQTILKGQAYQLPVTSYFSDPDGQTLTFQAQGLPAGLSLNGSVINGVPSVTGLLTVSITALDPGGLSASASFQLTVNPMPSTPSGFTITGVSTVSCQVLSLGERQLTFTPQYAGVSGAPISFSVVNEKRSTLEAGPYSLNLYTDNPSITLSAQQGSAVATYRYVVHRPGWE